MRAAGIRQFGAAVEPLGLPAPAVQVIPNGPRLTHLLMLFASGTLTIEMAAPRPLDEAAAALALARKGMHGAAVVLRP